MNSDHAPTAEEQLPNADVIPEDGEVLTRWQKDYPSESSAYFACALRCRIRERQLSAAIRSNREKDAQLAEAAQKLANYAEAVRVLSEQKLEKDAKNAELERRVETLTVLDRASEEQRNWLITKKTAAEALLRAVSDALDDGEQFDDIRLARIRAIVEGK